MPAKKEYTAEFKEQAVRFVLEELEPDESRKHACDRHDPKLRSRTNLDRPNVAQEGRQVDPRRRHEDLDIDRPVAVHDAVPHPNWSGPRDGRMS